MQTISILQTSPLRIMERGRFVLWAYFHRGKATVRQVVIIRAKSETPDMKSEVGHIWARISGFMDEASNI